MLSAFKIVTSLTNAVHAILSPFVSEEKLRSWKPIHLCEWFRKNNQPVPRYFIGGGGDPPSVTTNAATSIVSDGATLNGNVTSDGGQSITARGFVYSSTDSTPTIGEGGVTDTGNLGGTTGTYSTAVSGLTGGATYYFQAYATNSKGTTYGGVLTFVPGVAPTVTTQAVSGIAETSLTGNGNITDTGGINPTVRGFCYITGTSGDPTTADSTASDSGSFGTGAYTKSITGLSAHTAYRVRAYATNSKGTGYGTTVQAYTTPTVALNTPNDTATGVSTTPDLVFTGTSSGNDIEYQVQVGTSSDLSESAADSYSESNQSGSFTLSTSSPQAGQSFTGGGVITKSTFYLGKNAGGVMTGTLVAKLYAHSGTFGSSSVPTGSALATSSTVNMDSITESHALVDFDFSGDQYQMVSGTKYCIVVEASYTTGGSLGNRILVGNDATSPTHSGNIFQGDGVGGWTANSSIDAIFYVYSTSVILDKLSETPDAGFSGTGDPHPWPSGNAVTYTVQAGDALSNSTTYYWRVRAKDPSGSNTFGSWATTRSFTTLSGATTINVSDTATITESVTVELSAATSLDINVSDTTTITDTATVQINGPDPLNVSTSDTATISESVSVQINGPDPDNVSTSDTTTVSDVATVLINTLYPTTSNTATVSENVTIQVNAPDPNNVSVSDSTTISENVSVQINGPDPDNVSTSDTTTVSDTANLSLNNFINVNDETTISESVTLDVGSIPPLTINVSDTTTVSDVATPDVKSHVNVSDEISLSESVVVLINQLYVSGFDVATITESIASVLTSYINVFDETTLSESVSVQVNDAPGITISVSDTITVTDSATSDVVFNITVSDQTTVTDVATPELASIASNNVDVFDGVSVSESTDVKLTSYINVSDDITLTESVTTLINFLNVVTSDDITLSDSISILLTSYISVYDDLAISEDISLILTSYTNLSDTSTISENVSLSINGPDPLSINVSDTATITENVTATLSASTVNVSVYDTVSGAGLPSIMFDIDGNAYKRLDNNFLVKL